MTVLNINIPKQIAIYMTLWSSREEIESHNYILHALVTKDHIAINIYFKTRHVPAWLAHT